MTLWCSRKHMQGLSFCLIVPQFSQVLPLLHGDTWLSVCSHRKLPPCQPKVWRRRAKTQTCPSPVCCTCWSEKAIDLSERLCVCIREISYLLATAFSIVRGLWIGRTTAPLWEQEINSTGERFYCCRYIIDGFFLMKQYDSKMQDCQKSPCNHFENIFSPPKSQISGVIPELIHFLNSKRAIDFRLVVKCQEPRALQSLCLHTSRD